MSTGQAKQLASNRPLMGLSVASKVDPKQLFPAPNLAHSQSVTVGAQTTQAAS